MNSTQLVRYPVEQATRLLGWVRRSRRIKLPASTGKQFKVNLGCGLSVAPGWINIDGSLNALVAGLPRWVHPIAYKLSGANQFYTREYYCDTLSNNFFVHHNLNYSLPLPEESVDFIYSSHFLEHMEPQNARRLLNECLRALKPGGVIRVGIPDLEYAWELYRQGEKEKMLHDYFFCGGDTGFSRHRYAYDFDMLKSLLTEIGFDAVTRVRYQEGTTPDLSFLDNREDYTLFVEARRPNLPSLV